MENLWKFYLHYKQRHRVDDIQREEQRLQESGTFSSSLGEYVQPIIFLFFIFNLTYKYIVYFFSKIEGGYFLFTLR